MGISGRRKNRKRSILYLKGSGEHLLYLQYIETTAVGFDAFRVFSFCAPPFRMALVHTSELWHPFLGYFAQVWIFTVLLYYQQGMVAMSHLFGGRSGSFS